MAENIEVFEKFNQILASNKSLKSLHLSENGLGEYNNNWKLLKNGPKKLPIEFLKIGLIENKGIENLNLSFNKFSNEENCLRALAEIIVANNNLREIKLECKTIDLQKLLCEIEKTSIFESLDISKIKKISLNYNNITNDCSNNSENNLYLK